jgi:hypothetical protein
MLGETGALGIRKFHSAMTIDASGAPKRGDKWFLTAKQLVHVFIG